MEGPGQTESLEETLAEAARELAVEDGPVPTLQRGVDLASEIIKGCAAAGTSIVYTAQRIDTPAASHPSVLLADQWQYELGEGPCLQSIVAEDQVHSVDLARDPRWPRWSARTVEKLGYRSMLCIKLFVGADTLGALNLYGADVDAFDEEDRSAAWALASHLAVAYLASNQIAGLTQAVSSRTVIGMAEGILMERFKIGADRAFALLRRTSSQQNRKLRSVAEEIVRGVEHQLAPDRPPQPPVSPDLPAEQPERSVPAAWKGSPARHPEVAKPT